MQSVLGLILGASLVAFGLVLDASAPLSQAPLFLALQLASLGGAGLGVLAGRGRLAASGKRLVYALLALLGWRLAYFPVMVFSGHVASIGEWLLLGLGAPVVVYPVFLLAIAAIHLLVAGAVGFIVVPPRVGGLPGRFVRAPLLAGFAVAFLVSFNGLEDFHLLPDRTLEVAGPIPGVPADGGNPYLTALTAPGYLPNQRVMLVAAGLTYDTIPPSPWARGVRAVLEQDFRNNPHGSTTDRVREHYLAYHAAHPLLGCPAREDCPARAAP